MNDENTTWGKFETRSIVRPKIPLKSNYAPEIESELESYTWGPLETRSIVRPPIHLNMQRVQPYLKMTLGFRDDVELTHDAVMQIGAKLIASVIEAAPELRLEYSTSHSKVEHGRLIAALIPQNSYENIEELLREFNGQLRNRVTHVHSESAQPIFTVDYITMGSCS